MSRFRKRAEQQGEKKGRFFGLFGRGKKGASEQDAVALAGRESESGIDGFLGLRITEVEAGRLVCEMPVGAQLMNPLGTMHGGCISALCDHVLGMVMYPVMPSGYWAATTEFRLGWEVLPDMEAIARSTTSTPAAAASRTEADCTPAVSCV